jgi:O-antigen ligase
MTRFRIPRVHLPDVSSAVFVFLWALIFCIPWEEEATVAQGVALSRLVGAVACVAGVLAVLISWRIRKLHPVHYLLCAWVVWMTASYCWTIAPDLTAARVGSNFQLLLMVWLIWEFAPTQPQQVSLFGAYVLGSYVSALSTIYAFVTHTGSNLGLAEGRYVAAGFDENELGITLALSLVMSCYLLAHNRGWRPIWLLHIPICVLAICLTGSRGALISSGVAALIFPLSFGSLRRTQKWFLLSTLLLLAVTAVVFIPQTTWNRLGTIRSEVKEGSLSERKYIWAAGLEVYCEHPIAGVGAGAFGPSVHSRLDMDYAAHNSFLSILVELGGVGAIIFSAVFVSLFYLGVSLPKLECRTWLTLLLTWSVAVSTLTWEYRKPTWFLFGLLIAQSAAVGRPRNFGAIQGSLVPASRVHLSEARVS